MAFSHHGFLAGQQIDVCEFTCLGESVRFPSCNKLLFSFFLKLSCRVLCWLVVGADSTQMVSLDLKDLERGVGADLFRRPIVTAILNAFILRLYYSNVFEWPDDFGQDPDPEDDEEKGQFIILQPPAVGTYDAEEDAREKARQTILEHVSASFIYILTHLIVVVGIFETAAWIVAAFVFKLIGLPRIYAFEKLLLDVRTTVLPQTVRYIDRNVRLISRSSTKLPHLTATRRGLPFMPITIIAPSESLTRETATLLRLLRYLNRITISYWTEDALVLVGRNEDIVRALCNLNEQPVHIDLGWHRDVLEFTTYKLSITFTREMAGVNADMPPPSPVRAVGNRVVVVQLYIETTSPNMELLLQSMDQFGAVCEAAEPGRRQFNGKRTAIYAIGIFVAIILMLYYQDGESPITKPSIDVLTLAVGAYTLWMTIGKSAALGETEEETLYNVVTRDNILLTYHGLTKVEDNVINTCWVPEVHREERAEPPEDAVLEDGSISLIEAAIYLNIYLHYGHLIKWSGSRLILDRYRIKEEPDDPSGVGHVVAVDRVARFNLLRYRGESMTLKRLGGSGRHRCRHTRYR